MRRYKETHVGLEGLPDKVSFQLNDTHPTIGVAELMRLLMDENGVGWTQAWDLTCKVLLPPFPPAQEKSVQVITAESHIEGQLCSAPLFLCTRG